MPLKTCIVSYTGCDCKRSVEVLAETLNEAAVLGLKAMNVPGERLHLLRLDVLVKAPHVYHSISRASLSAWLAQPGKSAKERALKARLNGLLPDQPRVETNRPEQVSGSTGGFCPICRE